MNSTTKQRLWNYLIRLLFITCLVAVALSFSCEAQDTSARGVFDQAVLLLNRGSPQEALNLFQVAAALYAKERDPMGFVNAIFGIGECMRMLGHPVQALAPYSDAYKMAMDIGYISGAAMAAMGMGGCYEQQGDYDTAAKYYTKGKELYEKLTELEAAVGQAQALCKLGDCLRLQGSLDEALPLFRKALEFAQIAGVPTIEVDALRGIGDCLKGKAQYSKALEEYDKGLAIAQAENYRLGIASTLLGGADCLKGLTEYEEAYDRFDKARAIYHAFQAPTGEVQTLSGMGECLKAMGLYERAIDTLEEASAISSQFSFSRGKGMALWGIGDALALLGRSREALSYLEKSLQIFQSEKDAIGEANVRYSMGKAYLSLSDNENAFTNFTTCYKLYHEHGSPQGEANTLLRIGDHLWAGGLPAPALEFYHLAEPTFDTLHDPIGKSLVLIGEGSCHLTLGDLSRAEACLQQAAQISETTREPINISVCAYRLAEVYVAQGDIPKAIGEYEIAVEKVESVASSLSHEGLRSGVFEDVQTLYQHIVGLLAKQGHGAEALFYAERARGRTSLDILVGGAIASSTIAGVEGLSAKATVNADEIQQLIGEVPDILNSGEAVLVYAWGIDHLFTWVVTQEQGIEGPFVQSVSYNQFLGKVYEFRSQLESADPNTSAVERALQRSKVQTRLREFYSELIAPVERRIAGKETLIIIPSGPLWYVPFAALRTADEGTSYLIERYAIAYAPSLASLPTLLTASKDAAGTSPLLAFVNPQRDDMPPLPHLVDAARAFSRAIGGGSFYAEKQATEAQLDQVVLPRRTAETEEPKTVGKRYKYILFGCHGKFSYANPLYSYLALGPGQEEDGDLYAREVLDLDLKGTRLVMLLACETFLTAVESRAGSATAGMGSDLPSEEKLSILQDLTKGDELVGLSRAFMLAGAQAVLATNWEVQVGAASQLASALGEALTSDLAKAQALQAAQLQLINDGKTDPWLWAPFLLIGNWR